MAIVRSVAVCVFGNALTVAETSAGRYNVEDGHDGGRDRHSKGSHYKQYVTVDREVNSRANIGLQPTAADEP